MYKSLILFLTIFSSACSSSEKAAVEESESSAADMSSSCEEYYQAKHDCKTEKAATLGGNAPEYDAADVTATCSSSPQCMDNYYQCAASVYNETDCQSTEGIGSLDASLATCSMPELSSVECQDDNADTASVEPINPYVGDYPISPCSTIPTATGNSPGQVTADFGLVDQFGDTVYLSDFCNKVVLLKASSFG